MQALQPLRWFVAVADLGSMTAAAAQFGVSAAAVSAAMKRLEAELGVVLLVRSTRSLRLTPQGEVFLGHARAAVEAVEAGVDAATSRDGAIRGVLRVSAPSDLGRRQLLPVLDALQARNPGLRVVLSLSDRRVDFYREPVDLALRYGVPPDSALVAAPLAPEARRIACASPAYLERVGLAHAELEEPEGLTALNALCFHVGGVPNTRWRFERGGETRIVNVHGDRSSDDSEVVTRWALNGHGVIFRSVLDMLDDLEGGALRPVLRGWSGEPAPLYLVYPDRRSLGPAARALQRALVEAYAARSARAAALLTQLAVTDRAGRDPKTGA